MSNPVIIVPYNPQWPDEFNKIKNMLLMHLNNLILSIEHIGSTSVPNLSAKPIIDINMIMESYEVFPDIVNRLKEIGYKHEGDLGVKGREAFRQPSNNEFIYFHLYCSPKDSEALRRHIQFREYLRNHSEARQEYENLKINLAQKFRDDRVAYTESKTEFIQNILRKCSMEESCMAWEANADFWDIKMGDNSNSFHLNLVRPHTESLLGIKANDLVLDIACGNGNFSSRLAELGAKVVAFDYSNKMIANAKIRRSADLEKIDFFVCDATNYQQMLDLKKDGMFDKAVANMAVMDISDIAPMFQAVYDVLKSGGIFVFSTHHPCFIKPADKYITSCTHKGEAIAGQPMLQNYYHRSMQELFNICLRSGFVIDGFFEEVDDDKEIPVIIIVRLRKQ